MKDNKIFGQSKKNLSKMTLSGSNQIRVWKIVSFIFCQILFLLLQLEQTFEAFDKIEVAQLLCSSRCAMQVLSSSICVYVHVYSEQIKHFYVSTLNVIV